MTFGEKILMLRKEKGMSQEDLASKLGVSRQAISRWELEGVLPDASNIVELSKLFGVSTDYLLKDEMAEEVMKPTESSGNALELMRNEKNAMIGLYVVLALHTLAFLISLYGYIEKNKIAILAGIPLHFVILASFEMGYAFYKKSGIKEFNPKLHIYYHRVAVWLIAYFPIWVLITLLFRLYPRPYYAIIPELISILLYLIVCVSVTKKLKKKL